jgi:hypothetical protein
MAKRKIRECKELTETIEINASNKLAKLSSSSLSKQRRNDVTFSITPLPNTHNMIAVENNTNALTVCPFCGTNLQDLDIKVGLLLYLFVLYLSSSLLTPHSLLLMFIKILLPYNRVVKCISMSV